MFILYVILALLLAVKLKLTYGEMTAVCIRFLLLSQSLIKPAHPLHRAAVTRRVEGGATRLKSAAGERQVSQEDTRHTWNIRDGGFRIKAPSLNSPCQPL